MITKISPADAADFSTIQNLMSLYLFEHSARLERDVDSDGLFHYDGLEAYWRLSGRYAFLTRADDQLAGFALVLDRAQLDPGLTGHVIAEFFILPRLRRRGIGREAAFALFNLFAGAWWIPIAGWNTDAQLFWRRVVQEYTRGQCIEERWSGDSEEGVAWFFEAGPARAPSP